MKRCTVLRLLAALGLGAGTAGVTTLASSAAGGMMGRDSMGSSGDMNLVMALFRNHQSIRRTVEDLPNGIRATTESDDPQVAALIRAHVAAMYQRIALNRPFTMMSPTLPALFRNKQRYDRRLTMTPKGVAVTETSADRHLVAVIQAHGREVTGFVNDGMAAMMRDMMGGGMMQR